MVVNYVEVLYFNPKVVILMSSPRPKLEQMLYYHFKGRNFCVLFLLWQNPYYRLGLFYIQTTFNMSDFNV